MPRPDRPPRIAVVGHVEHVSIGRVPALPSAGDIAHMKAERWIAGGGGGIAFQQLAKGPGEILLYTAAGNDEAAAAVVRRIEATGARVYVAKRDEPHTRDIVMITPGGERTIVVVGEPLHPRIDDPLPWDELTTCDAAYFTGQDPQTIVAARRARLLIVTARRAEALEKSGVRADVVVGSATDPREASDLADYPVRPGAVVMTQGAIGGRIETEDGTTTFPAPESPPKVVGVYGAGDSFAGALTWYLACGVSLPDACVRAGHHGAAVLRGFNPLEHQIPLEFPDDG
jgi:ribokinase